MTKFRQFDVLVVYSEKLATSASVAPKNSIGPFRLGSKNQNYNTVYGFFLQSCLNLGLTVAFTTSADIIGPGFCRSFWEKKEDRWLPVNLPCYSNLIFDKFSPTNPGIKHRRELLFSEPAVKPFNHPTIYNLFFDKYHTFNKLSSHSIPTISIHHSQNLSASLTRLSEQLSKHPHNSDFSSDYVLKDRFGSGGLNVYKINIRNTHKISKILQRHPKTSFILQPFVNFTAIDIRLIYLKGQIVQAYVRQAKPTDFRCNEHRGGVLTYISILSLPPNIVDKANQIVKILDNHCSLFTLDFIISTGGNIFLLEGNTGPGLDWNESLPQNEVEAKKLIQLVASELAVRTKDMLHSVV